jgi:hypothetical protein
MGKAGERDSKGSAAVVADPPRKNRALLAVSVVLWVGWLGVLVFLAWGG